MDIVHCTFGIMKSCTELHPAMLSKNTMLIKVQLPYSTKKTLFAQLCHASRAYTPHTHCHRHVESVFGSFEDEIVAAHEIVVSQSK